MFRNLAHLNIHAFCYEGQCIFKLKNDDVAELAMALPQLEHLHLGFPCQENTCATTAACLLQLSVHCLKLGHLSIHFNTTNIVDDFKNILVDPQFRELRSLPKCRVSCLDVEDILLTLNTSDAKTVVDGMRGIFPNLLDFGVMSIWREISKGL